MYTLGQLSPSNVEPPCPEDEPCPTTGDPWERRGSASSAKEITRGALAPWETTDQMENETQNVKLPLAFQ